MLLQAMAFTRVIGGKSCIVADQSGSGKTLAYLIPLVQRLRQEELEGFGKPASQNPRVIILVPTAELASQVRTFFGTLFHNFLYKSMNIEMVSSPFFKIHELLK